MKKWNAPPVPQKPIVMPSFPAQVVEEKIAPKAERGLKCIRCFSASDVMFEGSSWCEPCIKEKLRTGL